MPAHPVPAWVERFGAVWSAELDGIATVLDSNAEEQIYLWDSDPALAAFHTPRRTAARSPSAAGSNSGSGSLRHVDVQVSVAVTAIVLLCWALARCQVPLTLP